MAKKHTPYWGSFRSVESFRERAKKKLPKGLFEFIDRGSDEDIALAGNRAAFDRIKFRPRFLVDVSTRSASSELFGKEVGAPLVIAPTGSASMVWYRGEVELARAAAKLGVPFTLGTRSMTSIETIAAEAGGTLWMQLYTNKDRQYSYDMIAKAAKSGFEALVVTVDTPAVPSREYNDRNGYSLPFRLTRRGVVDILKHPRWLTTVIGRYMLNGGLPAYENLHVRRTIMQAVPVSASLTDDLSWADIKELRKRWPGKLLVKGILHPADAKLAIAHGADGVIVSNHGGRNLDHSVPPIEILPEIVAEIGHKGTVLMDSGIRRGSDVAKALALGAKAVLIGRAPLYGTAVAGQDGAEKIIEGLRGELLYTMAMLGCVRIGDLKPELIHAPHIQMAFPGSTRAEAGKSPVN